MNSGLEGSISETKVMTNERGKAEGGVVVVVQGCLGKTFLVFARAVLAIRLCK